ncbi:hypothetical protein EWM64_g7141 [Hericium alpestre]|uniref:Uncharacterized protein n=1 Tax=Hericium alpestre TaxID=135208 RepID=A0A4Y9ZSS8_9AGAM|nr:hypothetical protein EWM64_g7141 [Hericium alpestre]
MPAHIDVDILRIRQLTAALEHETITSMLHARPRAQATALALAHCGLIHVGQELWGRQHLVVTAAGDVAWRPSDESLRSIRSAKSTKSSTKSARLEDIPVDSPRPTNPPWQKGMPVQLRKGSTSSRVFDGYMLHTLHTLTYETEYGHEQGHGAGKPASLKQNVMDGPCSHASMATTSLPFAASYSIDFVQDVYQSRSPLCCALRVAPAVTFLLKCARDEHDRVQEQNIHERREHGALEEHRNTVARKNCCRIFDRLPVGGQ